MGTLYQVRKLENVVKKTQMPQMEKILRGTAVGTSALGEQNEGAERLIDFAVGHRLCRQTPLSAASPKVLFVEKF